MKTITQDEVNKACRSRSLVLLDDVMFKLQIELLTHQEYINELSDQGKKPTMSENYETKVLKLNLDRINARITELGKRALEAQRKKEEDKIKLELYRAHSLSKMPMQRVIKEHEEIEPKRRIVVDDPIAEASIEAIKARVLAGESFKQIAKNASAKTGNTLLEKLLTPHEPDPDTDEEPQDVNEVLKNLGDEL